MAEQYASFQGKEPNIDVNLFVNALTQGIAAGNAQKSTAGAIFSGLQAGIDNGIKAYQGVQQIQANAAELDPVVIQAKKDKQVADAQIAQAKAKAAALDDGTAAKADAMAEKVKLKESEQKYGDITTKDTIGAMIDGGIKGAELVDALTKASGTMSRDNEFAQQALAYAKGKIPDENYNAMVQQAQAVETAKQDAQLRAAEQRGLQDQAIKLKDKFDDAASAFKIASPQLGDLMQGDFDPADLRVLPAASVARDKDKNVQFDLDGLPVLADPNSPDFAPSLADDKRYYGTYRGKVVGTFDETKGKELSGLLTPYQKYAASIKTTKETTPTPNTPSNITQEGAGLAAQLNETAATVGQDRIDRYAPTATSGTNTLTGPSPESLKGKTPAQQDELRTRFQQRAAELKQVSGEYRATYERVQADPALRNQAAIVKAFASVESGGKRGAKSPLRVDAEGNVVRGGVKGLMQVTGPTFDEMQEKYPTKISKAAKGTEEGSVLAGRMYITELLVQFQDIQIAAAAYNAGPGVVAQAVKNVKGPVSWETVKPQLEKLMSQTEAGADKFKEETAKFPDRILAYYKLYNG